MPLIRQCMKVARTGQVTLYNYHTCELICAYHREEEPSKYVCMLGNRVRYGSASAYYIESIRRQRKKANEVITGWSLSQCRRLA